VGLTGRHRESDRQAVGARAVGITEREAIDALMKKAL
jgi:hypothetical protein